MRWAGVDVGGKRKGFDLAVIEMTNDGLSVRDIKRSLTHADVIAVLETAAPSVVAVDGPISAAPDGCASRCSERQLVRSVGCHIRYTPQMSDLRKKETGYYGWVFNGFNLYEKLAAADEGWSVIECFPTASWTRLGRRRGTDSRAKWSDSILRTKLGLGSIPARLNQDARDAIVAAYTAYLFSKRRTDCFCGEIVVPK